MMEQEYRFDAGRLSLDILATTGLRCGERLPDPAALGAWMLGAGLFEKPCGVGASDLAEVHAVRGALSRVVDALLHGDPPSTADLNIINAAAAVPATAPRLELKADGLRRERGATSVAEALGEIARDAIDLFTGPERDRVRECAAEDCSGIYVDSSRGRTRRWCSTGGCGNRARVAAHRRRRAGGGEEPAA
jgi:predicted RNA-binding Zn ribbon-like protein